MKIELVAPAKDDACAVMEYRREFLENGDSMDGTSGLRTAESYESWLESIARNAHEETVQKGWVPEHLFLAKDENAALVGIIDVRHRLSKRLMTMGGHIGYSVRPERRRCGCASEMLRLALIECKKLGIERVLVTCDDVNIASARVIEKNGGVMENRIVIYEDERLVTIRRYWIDNK